MSLLLLNEPPEPYMSPEATCFVLPWRHPCCISSTYYLLENHKRKKDNTPYITLEKEEYLYFSGVLKQLVSTLWDRRPHSVNTADKSTALVSTHRSETHMGICQSKGTHLYPKWHRIP